MVENLDVSKFRNGDAIPEVTTAKAWLAAREAELLPVRYFHLVFTLPKPITDIAYQNKREIYNLLMRVSADTVLKIAADPKHLGARIGVSGRRIANVELAYRPAPGIVRRILAVLAEERCHDR